METKFFAAQVRLEQTTFIDEHDMIRAMIGDYCIASVTFGSNATHSGYELWQREKCIEKINVPNPEWDGSVPEKALIALLDLTPLPTHEWQFFKAADSRRYWRTVGRNGEKDGRSGQGYYHRKDCYRNARKFGWAGNARQVGWLDESKNLDA